MARHIFGGGVADWTFTADAQDFAVLAGGITVAVYNAETGGSQLTDLLNMSSVAVDHVVSSDGTDGRSVGQIPPFYGPDNVTQLWASADAGPRALMVAVDAGDVAKQASTDAATALSAAQSASSSLAAHVAGTNPHGTTFAILADVDMTSLVDGQIPVWNAAAAKWNPGTFSGGGGGTGSTAAAAVLVASSDMPTVIKNAADFVCTGTGDQTQINAAIAAAVSAAGGRGRVQLTGGRFNCSGSILMKTGVWLSGAGPFTEVKAINITTVTGAGDQAAIVKLFDVNTHLTFISDMWLNLNSSPGGTGHGICYESASSGDSESGYPDSNPDCDENISNLFISNGGNGTTRKAIYARTDLRGSIVHNIQIRSMSSDGIHLESAPDCHFSLIHMGTIAGTGFHVGTGNAKFNNCKAYYCDQWGFDVSSGRGGLSGCESQDNANGVRLTGPGYTVAGLMIDTSETDSLSIGANGLNVSGVTILNRGNGRYPTTANGVVFAGTPTNCHVDAVVVASNVTTPVVGTYTGAANEITISDGTRVYSTRARVTASTTQPSNPQTGDIWIDLN